MYAEIKWHPESPGMTVIVGRTWWQRILYPRDFATLTEALRASVTATKGEGATMEDLFEFRDQQAEKYRKRIKALCRQVKRQKERIGELESEFAAERLDREVRHTIEENRWLKQRISEMEELDRFMCATAGRLMDDLNWCAGRATASEDRADRLAVAADALAAESAEAWYLRESLPEISSIRMVLSETQAKMFRQIMLSDRRGRIMVKLANRIAELEAELDDERLDREGLRQAIGENKTLKERTAELEKENRRDTIGSKLLAAQDRADQLAAAADSLASELEAYENQEQETIEILDGNAAFLDKRHAEIDAKEDELEAENERLREALYRIAYVEAHDMGELRLAAKAALPAIG